MGTWEFGLTVALVGSVGTLLVLWLLSLLIPPDQEDIPLVRLVETAVTGTYPRSP